MVNYPTAIVTTIDGYQHKGIIVHAGDSLLMLHTGARPVTASGPYEVSLVLAPDQIQSVVFPRQGRFLRSAIGGFIIGGGIGFMIGGLISGDSDGNASISMPPGFAMVGLAMIIGLPSALISGIVGAATGRDETFFVGGERQRFRKIIPLLNQRASGLSPAPAAEPGP